MVGTIRNNYYFCTVKITERHEVAAEEQHFLCQLNIISNNKRKEWGCSNAPEVKHSSVIPDSSDCAFFFNV